jgi:hypothetical protein
MRSDLLHVVTAVANPLRWTSRDRLMRDFAAHMQGSGVALHVVECAYGDRAFAFDDLPGTSHIGVRAHSLVWTKENLLNIGISRLPQDWKYVAWIDADITFRRADWAAETVHALQLHDIVQPWSDCYDLGPNGEHIAHHRSFCRQYADGAQLGNGAYTFAHPSYAWAATRGALQQLGGLIESAALGAADHHMALALVGMVELSVHQRMSAAYRAPLSRWQDRARRHIGGNIGYVPGTIEHSWHGPKASRRYVERWDVLVRHGFDPEADLKRNVWGVLELAGNKPDLRRDMARYFRQRQEDANVVEI